MSSPILLPDTITMATCSEVAVSLQRLVDASPQGPVALDASALKHFDSSFWSVFASLKRASSRVIVINNLPAQLQALGSVYGIWGTEASQ